MISASRHVPVAPDDLTGWCGPVVYDGKPAVLLGPDADYPGQWSLSRLDGFDAMNDTTWCICVDASDIQLDVTVAAIRDRLIRCYALTSWHRDTPGGLSPEQSAAVVLGSVLRVRAGMKPIRALAQRRRAYHYAVLAGDPTLLIGINAREEDVLVRGGSLLTPTGILLPPIDVGGESVLWSVG